MLDTLNSRYQSSMVNKKISILWPWELPEKIEGVAVVIDILGATSNMAYLVTQQTKDVLILNEKSLISALERYPEAVFIGDPTEEIMSILQRYKRTIYSTNHPSKVRSKNVQNKIVFYISNNGSRVVEDAFSKGAKAIITASFINFHSICTWLLSQPFLHIYLIPAGERTIPNIRDKKALEDSSCAEAFRRALEGKEIQWQSYWRTIRTFIERKYDYSPSTRKGDIDIIVKLDTIEVVPVCRKGRDGFIHVTHLPR